MSLRVLRDLLPGKPRRQVAVPPLVAWSHSTNRVCLCLPLDVARALGEHLKFWADVTDWRGNLDSDEVGHRYEYVLVCWATELLSGPKVLWLAPEALNRLKMPLSQAVMLYETLRTEDYTSTLAPLRDQLHKLLV